jgi:hypothetical protein
MNIKDPRFYSKFLISLSQYASKKIDPFLVKLSNRFTLGRYQINLERESVDAMISVKANKRLLRYMLMLSKVILGRLNSNWVRLAYILHKDLWKIYKEQGSPGYVKYLKTCSILIQQVVSGYKILDVSSVGPRISRSKTGLPRILPILLRRRIDSGDTLSVK